jgi:DNA-binding NarL/FixJ family response regulator
VAAAHAEGHSELDWLAQLAERAIEPLRAHAGVYAYTYRLEGAGRIVLGGVATCAASARYWPVLSSWGSANMRSIARLYRTQVMTLRSALDRARALGLAMSDPTRQFGAQRVRDLSIVMGQVGDAGVILTAPASHGVAMSAAERSRLERLASELALAVRIRVLRGHGPILLSTRERQVLEGLQCGMSDKAIAYGLGISSSTVAEYLARLRGKLQCTPGEELLALQPARSAHEARRDLWSRLTPAEHCVACSLISGVSHAQIAQQRGSSLRTVASQVASVFRKTGVSGQRELAARVLCASRK